MVDFHGRVHNVLNMCVGYVRAFLVDIGNRVAARRKLLALILSLETQNIFYTYFPGTELIIRYELMIRSPEPGSET